MLNNLFNNSYKKYHDARSNHLVEIKQPMILISQIQRSGGTLLSQLFDGHPQLFAHPYEVSWGKPYKWNFPNINQIEQLTPKSLWTAFHQPWIETYAKNAAYKKSPKKNYKQYPFLFDSKLHKKLFYSLCENSLPKTTRDALNTYLTSFFNAWFDYQDLYSPEKKFFTGFTPRILMQEKSAEDFFEAYPDGYIVSSVRHPAGWYSSAKEHGYKKHGEIESIMNFWINSCYSIAKAKEAWKDRLIVISFEELVRQPQKVMQHISKKTGLIWNDTLTKPTFNSIPIQSNSHYNSVTFVDPSVADNYKKVLDNETLSYIEKITSDAYSAALGAVEKI